MKELKKILQILEKEYPDTNTALIFKTPFQLLIATILSAQTTDTQVNKITPQLFKRFPGPKEFANAKIEEIQQLISSINFYKNKAANIKKLSEKLINDFNGKVPDVIDNLVTLPGVARKTANVVLSQAFGKNQGIVVDTHVKRISQRLGLTKNTDPAKIEKDLMNIIPKKKWGVFPFWLIQHGRKICKAKNPLCNQCVLARFCPYYKIKND